MTSTPTGPADAPEPTAVDGPAPPEITEEEWIAASQSCCGLDPEEPRPGPDPCASA